MAMTEDEACLVEGAINDLLAEVDDLKKKVKRLTKKLKTVELEGWAATHKCTSIANLLLDLVGGQSFLIEHGDPNDQSLWEWKFGSRASKDGGDPENYWDFASASRESFDRAGKVCLSLKKITELLASQPDPDGH